MQDASDKLRDRDARKPVGTRVGRASWQHSLSPASSWWQAAGGGATTTSREMRWALYVTFPPAWLDPAEVAVAGVTPFWIIYVA